MQAVRGILTYGLFLLFIIFVIKKIKVKDNGKLILFVSLAFGVLAFFQKPSEQSDLAEAFRYLNGLRQSGFEYFQNEHYTIQNYFSGKIGLQIYFYLCSLLPFNNFYSAIAVFLMYFFILKSIQVSAEYYQLEGKSIKNLFILFLLLFDFYDASNGVRNMFAFSMFVYGLTLDVFRNRKITGLLLYVIATTIHPSTAALIILRYLQILQNVVLRLAIGGVLLLWSSGITGISRLLAPFTGISAIAMIQSKLYYYSLLGGTNENFGTGFNTSSSYMMMRSFRIVLVITIIVITYVILKNTQKQKTIATFAQYLCFFSLGTLAPIMATNVFTRYSFAIIMITPILYAEYLNLEIKEKKLQLGGVSIRLSTTMLLIVILLFNYYMFLYHYASFGLAFKVYS